MARLGSQSPPWLTVDMGVISICGSRVDNSGQRQPWGCCRRNLEMSGCAPDTDVRFYSRIDSFAPLKFSIYIRGASGPHESASRRVRDHFRSHRNAVELSIRSGASATVLVAQRERAEVAINSHLRNRHTAEQTDIRHCGVCHSSRSRALIRVRISGARGVANSGAQDAHP